MIHTVVTKAIVGAAAATFLTVGAGTPAFASTATPNCVKAEARADKMQKAEVGLEQRIDTLRARDAKARAAHHDDVAQRIERRIDSVQKRHDRLADRVAKIRARCGAAGNVTPSPTPAQ
jgi:hypothetical protein